MAKAAKAGRTALKAAPVAAATAPVAAGGLGFVLLALGAVWAISRVQGPIADLFRGAKKAVQVPPDFYKGLTGEERIEREIPIRGFADMSRIDPVSGAARVYGTPQTWEPDVPTSYAIIGGEVVITNPAPAIPPPRFYEFDPPSAAREAGTYIRGNIEDAITIDEYTGDPFKGKIPGGPKFDILGWFR